ncbi:amino acid adenylation domain-containing protein [Actinomadura nitritigenes]|uniref:amino acid adenylation domain-containing protein n=1 Tax=Actinomadura nitritigenes TaxID=134602 RepID=UPI003D8B7C39
MPQRTLHSRFADSAARHPDAVALELAGDRLTYRELDELAARVAGRIAARCGGAPRAVGLHASRTLAAYAGYLAIQRLGAVTVPLNPSFPAERNERVIAAGRVEAVVSQDPGFAAAVPVIGLGPSFPDELAGERPAPPGPAGDTAYILFTSGSTGVPKGVPVGHDNLSAYLDHVVPRYGLGPGSRVSQTFDLTFDLSVFDLFASWASGAAVVVPRRGELMNPARFVTGRGITHWFSVPSLISVARRLGRLTPASMPDLRWSLFCGEQLTVSQARAWRDAAPNGVLENLYGPTELTLSCTQHRYTEGLTPLNGTVPIGDPYPGHDVLVIGEDGVPAPAGELCVRGPQRFTGYLDPADNAGRFVAFEAGRATAWDGPGPPGPELWYRTGDLVRREAGGLVHLGRTDHQVKVQGYRVELGEIESVLRDQPGVQDAIVVAVSQGDGAMALHAVHTGERLGHEELKAALARRLPPHMMPRSLTHWETLPLNDNGKVDRRTIADSIAEEREH